MWSSFRAASRPHRGGGILGRSGRIALHRRALSGRSGTRPVTRIRLPARVNGKQPGQSRPALRIHPMSVPRFLITAVLVVFAAGPRRASGVCTGPAALAALHHRGVPRHDRDLRASFSADGARVLFTSDRTGIFNVYTVPVAGGEPVPVTRSTTESTFGSGSSPRTTASSSPTTRGVTRTPTSTSSPTAGTRPDPGQVPQGPVPQVVARRLGALRT